jgi:formate hydrogenlyase subunit 3/multisubunit Na+/H+ antiporter MnhD subunit
MNAPLIWIGLPALASVGLALLSNRPRLAVLLATGVSLFLAGLAWLLPIGEALQLGSLTLRVEPALALAGRRLVLDQADRPLLTFCYALAAFWLAGTRAAGGGRLQVPFGLAIISVLVAAMAVEPELYAGLLVEGAVLLSIPIIAPPGQPANQGVLRYLIFQSIAMALFVIGSWALTGAAANPTDSNLTLLTAVFLGLAFALWLAVFPFYTWAPLLTTFSRPYASGFVFLFFPTTCLFLGAQILGANGWLRSEVLFLDVARVVGGVMVITAGFWAAFQRDLGRLLGYIAIAQVGFSLVALSLGTRLGDEIFIMMFLPRVVALGVWILSASVILRGNRSLRFSDIERTAERLPVASIGLAVSFLSLAGLPLLAEFPIRVVLLQEISTKHPIAALGILLGSLGLLFSAFRLLAVITGGSLGLRPGGLSVGETRSQVFLISFGIAALLIVGITPRVFFPIMVGILSAFGASP